MEQALETWGWNSHWEALFRGVAAPTGRPARVTSHHRDRWVLETARGTYDGRIVSLQDVIQPTTGDWVVAEPGPYPLDPWSIVEVLPRQSTVARGSAGDGRAVQVLAANVDRLWVVHGLDTAPNLRRLERYLAAGWESGSSPEVVLTKSDLATHLDESVAQVRTIALGVPLWVVGVSDPEALAELRNSLRFASTVALIGPSGVGKSTLINQLARESVATTGGVREGDGKGRHTTTARELVRIHNGALLLDTPGLRELRVLSLDKGLGLAFPKIEELAQQCRFRDCSHRAEPGCAVLRSVSDGDLAIERLASFRKLEAEADYERRKSDPRAQAEAVSEYKTAMKTLKQHQKRQQRS